jgi:hypothetical protein
VKEISIRHTKNAPERFARKVTPQLKAYAEASVVDVKAGLERAARLKIGRNDDEVLNWLRKHEFTKKESEGIIKTVSGVGEDATPNGWHRLAGTGWHRGQDLLRRPRGRDRGDVSASLQQVLHLQLDAPVFGSQVKLAMPQLPH